LHLNFVIDNPSLAWKEAILWLLGAVGLRVSEVAALKVEHLDDSGGYLHVVDGKGGKQRMSILPKPVLEAHLQGHTGGYVFEGRDQGHISTKQIQRLLDYAAEKAGLQETRTCKIRQRKRITPHLFEAQL
jgi:integrase/recombinase XerD